MLKTGNMLVKQEQASVSVKQPDLASHSFWQSVKWNVKLCVEKFCINKTSYYCVFLKVLDIIG